MLLSSLGLVLAACGPSRGGSSGSGGDDDDDDAAGSDGREDLPCTGDFVDGWSLQVSDGEQVTIRVDTRSADTAFDPYFEWEIGTGSSFGDADFYDGGEADDDVDCTFPPPEFSCPESTVTADGDGWIDIEVFVATDCEGNVGEYVLEIEGASEEPVLYADDQAFGGGDDDDDDAADDDDFSDDDDAADDDDVVGDDDDVADDDDFVGDDDDVADDDDDLVGSPQTGDALTCADTDLRDRWFVPLIAADQMVVEVDTVSAATTFDPYFDVYFESVFGNVVGGTDDSFVCTFPPPTYECPSDTIDAASTGNYIIDVGQASSGECVGSIAEYDLNITVNGLPVLGFLYEDNVAP